MKMPGTLQMEGVQLRIDFSFASVAPGQIPPISYATQKLLRVDSNTGFTRLLPHATCADHYINSEGYFVGRWFSSPSVHWKIRSSQKFVSLANQIGKILFKKLCEFLGNKPLGINRRTVLSHDNSDRG